MGILDRIKSLFGKEIDFREMIHNGAVVIDVRSHSEFRYSHAKGSKNIPLDALKNKVKGLEGKVVILVCRSGVRAERAKSILNGFGIDAVNAGAWQNVD